jgi:predicted unusual protein kinase regulating ubiquinone biosynthesis (AarF/ABC1/UbiB family)
VAGDHKLRTGALARAGITGLAVAQAGVAHLGHRARRRPAEDALDTHQAKHEAELGRILFRALNQLKGTALKASQILSMQAGFLPESMRQELARGFHQATPLNRALVHKVFRQEFSQSAEQLFQRFDSQAFAAASLGQVHHAELHGGERVVVKLQYPGIAASIASDMRMIRTLLQGLRLGTGVLPGAAIVERVMNDIEHKLAEEVDYRHEAEQLRWFGAHAPAAIIVPQPVATHSTQRVLTMQAITGQHLDAWLATRPTQQARNHAGQLLFDWFLHSVFGWRRLHADPHPGNFLFRSDGQLGVLDFGCTKPVSPAFAEAIACAWNLLLDRPTDERCAALRQTYAGLGLISPDLSAADFEQQLMPALAPLQAWQVEPFRAKRFDFTKRSPYPPMAVEQSRTVARFMTGIPEEMPYFERTLLGVNHMLVAMGAEVSTANPWIH